MTDHGLGKAWMRVDAVQVDRIARELRKLDRRNWPLVRELVDLLRFEKEKA